MTKHDDTRQARAHMPEPWTEEYLPYVSSKSSGTETEIPCYRIHPRDTPEQYVCETNEHLDNEVQYANARRICAAVNACKGISTEALERGIITELVEALQAIVKAAETNPFASIGHVLEHGTGNKALATLAKATGRAA